MRKQLVALALLAVTSCASMTETKVDDCAESMAYAALVCSSDSLFGAGDCAEAMSFVAIDCGYAVSDLDLPKKGKDCHTDLECYQQCLEEGNNEQDC